MVVHGWLEVRWKDEWQCQCNGWTGGWMMGWMGGNGLGWRMRYGVMDGSMRKWKNPSVDGCTDIKNNHLRRRSSNYWGQACVCVCVHVSVCGWATAKNITICARMLKDVCIRRWLIGCAHGCEGRQREKSEKRLFQIDLSGKKRSASGRTNQLNKGDTFFFFPHT